VAVTTVLELPVVRVQVQLRPLKPGRAPWRVYEPAALQQVSMLRVNRRGVLGVAADGTEHVDVHNAAHPQCRDRRGLAGISIMTTGDYAALRARYGPHLVDGIAGESMLLDHPAGLAGRSMPASLTIRTGDGTVLPLSGVHVAEPCVEFTRYCLRLPASDTVGPDVTAGLRDLDGGARGYKMVAGGDGRIRPGDVLLIEL
jgi:hypothetical protein